MAATAAIMANFDGINNNNHVAVALRCCGRCFLWTAIRARFIYNNYVFVAFYRTTPLHFFFLKPIYRL